MNSQLITVNALIKPLGYLKESEKYFTLNFLATSTVTETWFARDSIITYSQMHRTDKYSQHSSIIWPVWVNG